ncbi:MAG: hypothetical protein WKG06_06390 [Segetibacter sp.]
MVINKLKELLGEVLSSSGEGRIKAIKEFQSIIWDDTSIHDESLNDVLTDAAYILDFYEPNNEWRKEDPSYYGEDRLEEEIKSMIQKLKKQSPQ